MKSSNGKETVEAHCLLGS